MRVRARWGASVNHAGGACPAIKSTSGLPKLWNRTFMCLYDVLDRYGRQQGCTGGMEGGIWQAGATSGGGRCGGTCLSSHGGPAASPARQFSLTAPSTTIKSSAGACKRPASTTARAWPGPPWQPRWEPLVAYFLPLCPLPRPHREALRGNEAKTCFAGAAGGEREGPRDRLPCAACGASLAHITSSKP